MTRLTGNEVAQEKTRLQQLLAEAQTAPAGVPEGPFDALTLALERTTKGNVKKALSLHKRWKDKLVAKVRKDALSALGFPALGGTSGLVSKTSACQILGCGKATLDKLLAPECEIDNPHYKCASNMALYDPLALRELVEHPLVLAARERKAKGPRDYTERFFRRYGCPEAALKAACHSLWNLNRYAKHDSCGRKHKIEIYTLKNRLIAHLIGLGKLMAHGDHVVQLDCWCGGDMLCRKCEGSGVYRELYFDVLRFDIDGTIYTWHQPSDSFDCKIPEGTRELPTGNDDWRIEREKPIDFKLAKFAEAKALIRWVLGPEPVSNQEAA